MDTALQVKVGVRGRLQPGMAQEATMTQWAERLSAHLTWHFGLPLRVILTAEGDKVVSEAAVPERIHPVIDAWVRGWDGWSEWVAMPVETKPVIESLPTAGVIAASEEEPTNVAPRRRRSEVS